MQFSLDNALALLFKDKGIVDCEKRIFVHEGHTTHRIRVRLFESKHFYIDQLKYLKKLSDSHNICFVEDSRTTMAAQTSNPTRLARLVALGTTLATLETDWTAHRARVADAAANSGDTTINASTSIEAALTLLAGHDQRLQSRVDAVNARGIHFMRQPLQVSLRNRMSQEPTSTETAWWRFKCILAETQFAYEQQDGIIAQFEDAVDHTIKLMMETYVLYVKIEHSEQMQNALKWCVADDAFVFLMDDLRLAGAEISPEIWQQEEERVETTEMWVTCQKHIAAHERNVLHLLHALSETGVSVARQRLITEFFEPS